jgi:hypothetical protein
MFEIIANDLVTHRPEREEPRAKTETQERSPPHATTPRAESFRTRKPPQNLLELVPFTTDPRDARTLFPVTAPINRSVRLRGPQGRDARTLFPVTAPVNWSVRLRGLTPERPQRLTPERPQRDSRDCSPTSKSAAPCGSGNPVWTRHWSECGCVNDSPEWRFRFRSKVLQESSIRSTVFLKNSSLVKTNSLNFNP